MLTSDITGGIIYLRSDINYFETKNTQKKENESMANYDLFKETREIEIDELQDSLGMLIWQSGVEKFKITEAFRTKEEGYEAKEYILEGLEVEYEDGIAYFGDVNDDIYTEYHVLMALPLDMVKFYTFNSRIFEIVCPDGLIIIQAIMP